MRKEVFKDEDSFSVLFYDDTKDEYILEAIIGELGLYTISLKLNESEIKEIFKNYDNIRYLVRNINKHTDLYKDRFL